MAAQQKYDNVSLEDEHERDDSSFTEVEESLIGDEKQWNADRFQRYSKSSKRNTCWSTVKSLRWMVDTILLLIIVGLLLRDKWEKPRKTSERDVGGDITGVGPSCGFLSKRDELRQNI
jgi:hypothetical protein